MSASKWGEFSQCGLAGTVDNTVEYYIISQLDKKVVEKNSSTGKIEMRTRNDANKYQRWKLAITDPVKMTGQLINAADNSMLQIQVINDTSNFRVKEVCINYEFLRV